ncbi:MAG: hypothetical protein EOO38_00840 [Cytophagaceae bacterium]|nr:MAG: hypothetical protein EOO38_00840 [Cytophagaceae bacterium]
MLQLKMRTQIEGQTQSKPMFGNVAISTYQRLPQAHGASHAHKRAIARVKVLRRGLGGSTGKSMGARRGALGGGWRRRSHWPLCSAAPSRLARVSALRAARSGLTVTLFSRNVEGALRTFGIDIPGFSCRAKLWHTR